MFAGRKQWCSFLSFSPPRDFASSLTGKRESLPAWGSLELISKVVITWRDLLKNYSAMTVLKDKCRKWYFVPELILLPSAHWKILELLHKSEVSLSRAENDVEDVEWLLLMSMAGFGGGNSREWGSPWGNAFPCIQPDWRPSQTLERTRELPSDSGPDCEPFPTPGSCSFLNLLVLEGAWYCHWRCVGLQQIRISSLLPWQWSRQCTLAEWRMPWLI